MLLYQHKQDLSSGIITTNGDTVIDAAYDSIKHYFGDYYIVGNAGRYGVINTLKDIIIDKTILLFCILFFILYMHLVQHFLINAM